MKVRMVALVCALLVGIAAGPGAARAQDVSTAEQTQLAGPWHGNWTAPEGWLYEGVMRLRIGSSGIVEGEINWTLRTAARDREQAKIGMSGTEYIRGTYYALAGALMLEGYKKDDPNAVIGLDTYRLIASPDRKALAGFTAHGGRWNAQMLLTHQ